MATKKKTAKKSSKKPSKKVRKDGKAGKKIAAKKAASKQAAAPKKRIAVKPAVKKVSKKAAKGRKAPTATKAPVPSKVERPVRARGKREIVDTVSFEPEDLGPRSAGQSGDLQGISNVEGADSESVDELLEEGNAFEAEVIKGIQDAPDPDESEVTTHEFLEDDVPEEYTDQERPGRG